MGIRHDIKDFWKEMGWAGTLLILATLVCVGAALVVLGQLLYLLGVDLYHYNPYVLAVLPVVILAGGATIGWLGYGLYEYVVWKWSMLKLLKVKLRAGWYRLIGTKFQRSKMSKD